jgi:hypothetical protein
MVRTAIPELVVAAGEAGPGGLIHGSVSGDPEELRLIRFEGSPAGTVPVVLSRSPPGPDGEFELVVPENAAPSFASTCCSITYGVRAGSKRRSRTDPVVTVPVVAPLVHVAMAESGPLHDRMIARFDARHFHLELSHADVQGGGRIAGRVHLDRGDAPPVVTVTARCEEVWRIDRLSINLKRPPLWNYEGLWQERRELEWPLGQHWVGFDFALPPHLPPAVEASSIAWRYEVEVSRPTRFSMQERAVATPIGFELV